MRISNRQTVPRDALLGKLFAHGSYQVELSEVVPLQSSEHWNQQVVRWVTAEIREQLQAKSLARIAIRASHT
jgi:predicted HAD superfamily phosphohydrolase YqeG